MNEIGMTKRDVINQIKKEERYLRHCEELLLNEKSNIRATKNAIKMWKSHLKKLEKKGSK